MIAALVLPYLVYVVYLFINGMERCGVISPEYTNELGRRVEEISFVVNYFALNLTVWRLPQRFW